MKTNQLSFETICEKVETFEYTVRCPVWMKKRENENNVQQRNDGNSGKRQHYSRGRQNLDRTTATNQHIDDQMCLPATVKFGDVFRQENRQGTPNLLHQDGTERCLNFHHRGRCRHNCRSQQSHNKTLNYQEKADGRKYMRTLLGKFNARTNNPRPTVPNGKPRTPDTVQSTGTEPGK